MKLIGDDNQNGVFPADDSQNGFLPKDVFSVTINSIKLIEFCDIVYKLKTQSDQLIIPLSPGTIQDYCGQSTFLPLLLPLEPKLTKPGVLIFFLR